MIDGDAVVHERALPAPPEAVYEMFVEADQLVRWIGLSAELEAEPGGRFRFEVAPGQYCEGRYVELDPPRRIVFTWGWEEPAMGVPPGSSVVEVDLTAIDGGTRLRLTHSRLPGDDARLLHDDGWTAFLARLEAVAAGDPPNRYPSGDPRARLAQLREEGRA